MPHSLSPLAMLIVDYQGQNDHLALSLQMPFSHNHPYILISN